MFTRHGEIGPRPGLECWCRPQSSAAPVASRMSVKVAGAPAVCTAHNRGSAAARKGKADLYRHPSLSARNSRSNRIRAMETIWETFEIDLAFRLRVCMIGHGSRIPTHFPPGVVRCPVRRLRCPFSSGRMRSPGRLIVCIRAGQQGLEKSATQEENGRRDWLAGEPTIAATVRLSRILALCRMSLPRNSPTGRFLWYRHENASIGFALGVHTTSVAIRQPTLL